MIFLNFQSPAWDTISIIFIILSYAITIFLVIKTLLQNRNPITTLSWVMVLILIPFFGLLLYFLFGQKITKKWAFRRIRQKELQQMRHISNSQLKELESMDEMEDKYLFEYRKLISLLLKNNSSFLSSNNQVDFYHNGYQLFDQVFKDLEAARHFIHIQYYLFDDGIVSERIKEILIRKKQAGLNIAIILDGIGSRSYKDEAIDDLKKYGIDIIVFRPVRFPNLTNKMNHRNHRKIIVIDGKIAFTGGINIADKYLVKYGHKGFWRDTHVRVRGDAVKMLEAIFIVDRFSITKKMFKDLGKFFPKIENPIGKHIQIATNSPELNSNNILHAFFTAITTAKKSIKLISPYFIPDESLMMALSNAAMGGVKVEIILPGVTDSAFVQNTARSYVQKLLRDDINVYFYQKGFVHAKMLLIDDLFSMLGSANFDYRSLYYNFEVNTLIYDEEVNANLSLQFEKDKSDSDKIILAKWRKRPFNDKLMESLARLSAPLM